MMKLLERVLGAILFVTLAVGTAAADPLSELPAPWRDRLLPVVEADISGAEPLMQRALATARAEVATLLAEPDADTNALAEAYGRLGALLLLVEVEAQADSCLRNAMTLQPDELRWPYYAGYLAMLAGNLERAVGYLETARAIDPDYLPLYVRLGKVLFDASELEKARAALERAQSVPDLASPAHYYLGQIALLERRYDDAVVLLESALEADPDATEVHYPLAQAYRALGDSEQARQHLDRFQLRAPVIRDPLLEELQAATQRALPAFKRGIHAVRAGDYKTAVDELASGLEVDPDNAAARVSYARVLYLAGRRDAAAEELERALAVAPDQPLSHFLRGVLRQERGDQAGAVAAYRRALDLDPRHPGALFHLANLRLQAADFAGAAPLYEQVLAEDASVAPARVLALVAALRSGTPEAEILERLQALVAAHPEDLQQRYALARLLAAAQDTGLRDPQRALHIAAELAVESPMPAHQGLLALAQAAAGRFEEAVKTQRQLVSLAAWMAPPQELERLERELEAYESGRIPGPAWPADDPLLAPPPFDATRAFRDYPAVKPY